MGMLRVVTINVQNTEGDPRRTELINRELRRLEPDLVALQEVLDNPQRHQLDELLDGTGLHGTHQSAAMSYAPPWVERYGGGAVATRRPHQVVECLDLRGSDATDVPWCTLAAVVPVPDEGELLFIVASSSWRLEAEAARERQALALTDLDARHRRTLPTIVGGDLNAEPDASSIRYLTGRQALGGRSAYYHDAWAVAGDGPGWTWSVDNPAAGEVIDQIVRQPNHRRRIDYVLIGSWHAHPTAHCRVRSAELAFDKPMDGVWPSDHFGVVVDVEIGIITPPDPRPPAS
ncbi:endonuclease/exonuclease/phosphatase family protein [Pseudonocardia sp. DSM 110487]|uniref:endonuclease/exonuclease/phosphatase family protein n=1 Tax=Pseudonocardia sp. DSM 110487 TaxID=2865833 RepID=UPI001C698854|nr:endonuclease/exonuclease/phosphatase family protein [Pseudonocardia sp. DSM 110487]QYN39341.1 endonuclease/exonuclease/phosphatase family protein [Pseudonocardia sp. DSM 110487]